ncbi:MAG: phenylalanine--tRNA ligase subunit beta, partial [Candidatus Omnitrophota bacterium]
AINNVVDVTNFCLMEMGQPLHAFDYDKIQGGAIIVRRAKEGESIVTLDGIERRLDPSILVIADAKRPVAIAGIMGGTGSEVSAGTKNVLLESACFNPVLIRRAARKLGLSSDSSYRFERGISPDTVERGSARAISLIQQLAGGIIQKRQDVFTASKKPSRPGINVSLQKIGLLLGEDIPARRIKEILEKLSFKVVSTNKTHFKINPPLFRTDVRQAEDIAEEVARIIGYDNLSLSVPRIQAINISSRNNKKDKDALREGLVAQGLLEVITYTLIGRNFLEKTGLGSVPSVRIQNPLTQDQEMMRPALLPSFLSVLSSNLNKGQKDLKIFELGKIYSAKGEKEILGIMMTGNMSLDWRTTKKAQVDFYDLKGVVEQIFSETGIRGRIDFHECSDSVFAKKESATIKCGLKEIGCLGKISPAVLEKWDIKPKGIYFAQIDLQWLFENSQGQKHFSAVPEYPGIVRDISLAVKKEVSYRAIRETICQQQPQFLESIVFVEQYLGEKLPVGYKGLTISLSYLSKERTLREEEIASIHEGIRQSLLDKMGAIPR